MADDETRRGESSGGWLPPEPAGGGEGPEPAPAYADPQPGQAKSPPEHGWPPPGPPARAEPPGGHGWPPPGRVEPPGGQPPPGYGQQPPRYGQGGPGYGAAPGQHGQPHGWPQPGYGVPSEPGNGEAVASFVLGIAALSMLLVTFGFSTILSLACAAIAIFLGRKAKQKVDRGDTRKHRGLAQAGFIMGLIGVPLSIIAIAGWTLVILSDDFQQGFEEGFEDQQSGAGLKLGVGIAAAAARTLLG